MICSIYFSMAAFTDNIKFHLLNLNINNLMLINFHISLITKRLFRSFDHHSDRTVTVSQLCSFDHHSDRTVTVSQLLPNINKFRNKIFGFFRKFHEGGFWIVWVIICMSWILFFLKQALQWTPVLLQRIAELSSPFYILWPTWSNSFFTSHP